MRLVDHNRANMTQRQRGLSYRHFTVFIYWFSGMI